MSRWTDLLKSRAAAALDAPSPPAAPAPADAPQVQTSTPPAGASAPLDPGGAASWLETRAWLRTVQLPPGPLVVRRCSLGRPTRTLVDPALWQQAILTEMELLDDNSVPTIPWPLSLEAVAGRRRTLVTDVAEVQRALTRRTS